MEFELYRLGGIPVRVSIWALLLIGWLALRFGDPISGVCAAFGLLISVLIHEYGHALVCKRYGLMPSISLHMFGGATFHAPAKTDGQDALILVAGATLQLISAALFIVGWIVLGAAAPSIALHPYFLAFGTSFLYVGIFWAVINLLPLWPLDGGKLFRLGLLRLLNVKPVKADQWTHYVAIVGHVLMILFFWLFIGGFAFIAMLIFGMMIYQNYTALQAGAPAGQLRAKSTVAPKLLQEAKRAFADGQWREAARLGHQIRSEGGVSDTDLDEALTIITLASIADGRLEEGAQFARRAPATPQVVSGQVQALLALGDVEKARAVLADRGSVLPPAVYADLESRISPLLD